MSEKYILKIPFVLVKKKKTIKYLGINLTKDAKDLYAENYCTKHYLKRLKKTQ